MYERYIVKFIHTSDKCEYCDDESANILLCSRDNLLKFGD